MTTPTDAALLPCPFCGCQMRIESNRDWHRLMGEHGACVFNDEEATTGVWPATEEAMCEMVAFWNTRARELDAEKGGEEPERELLVSMAVRLDHGFGLRDEAWQAATLRDMRKVWEEVMGRGFYSPERKAFYSSMTTPPAQAAEAVERVAEALWVSCSTKHKLLEKAGYAIDWASQPTIIKRDYHKQARAAIAAMREVE